MKISYKWLQQHVDLTGLTPEDIAKKMTFAGAEVESIGRMASGTNLVIGKVLSCVNHPDSDHLHVLQVDEGPVHGVHQIVCGAPNAREGLKVIVARTGAKLPEVEIKASVIRGVESDGMCCSLLELGVDRKYLSDKQVAGIEELPEDAPVGEENVLGYLGLDDVSLDISVLPNRPDLYAYENVAREVACICERPLIAEEMREIPVKPSHFRVGSLSAKCPIFTARVITGVKTKPSPTWLSRILENAGIRSINNIVDIGNYVMLLTGQPLNMYDADKLPVRELIVRDDLEMDYVAMDGNTYKIIDGDLVVTSGGQPMCLAGIMTADACKVDERTSNIVVESAYFAGASIRHTSNRIGLSSDSALRFCKGINPHQNEYVQKLTSMLLTDLADAETVGETVVYDVYPHEEKVIKTSLGYINGRLGTSFTKAEVISALTRDHMGIAESGDELIVHVPAYRIDMEGEADVSEEVIRVLGYDNVKSIMPTVTLDLTGLTREQKLENAITTHLRERGLTGVLTYTLVSKKETDKFAYLNTAAPYVLTNPMTVEREAVRTNLAHSLLSCASYNAAHQNKDGAIYEVSDIDAPGVASRHLCAVLFGERTYVGDTVRRPYGFYDGKGLLTSIMNILGVQPGRYSLSPWSLGKEEFHPYRSCEIRMGKKLVGVLGEIHPNACKEYMLKNAVVLELDLAALLEIRTSPIKASVPLKYPAVTRDLAFVLLRSVSYEEVKRELLRADALIKGVSVFDIYEGEKVAEGCKSMAVTLTMYDPTRTLRDEEIVASTEKAIKALQIKFGAEIRQ